MCQCFLQIGKHCPECCIYYFKQDNSDCCDMCASFQTSPITSQAHLHRARGVIELDIVEGNLDRLHQSGSSKVTYMLAMRFNN